MPVLLLSAAPSTHPCTPLTPAPHPGSFRDTVSSALVSRAALEAGIQPLMWAQPCPVAACGGPSGCCLASALAHTPRLSQHHLRRKLPVIWNWTPAPRCSCPACRLSHLLLYAFSPTGDVSEVGVAPHEQCELTDEALHLLCVAVSDLGLTPSHCHLKIKYLFPFGVIA